LSSDINIIDNKILQIINGFEVPLKVSSDVSVEPLDTKVSQNVKNTEMSLKEISSTPQLISQEVEQVYAKIDDFFDDMLKE